MGSKKDTAAGIILTVFATILILAVMDVVDFDALMHEDTIIIILAVLILALGVSTVFTNTGEKDKVEMEVTEATLAKQ